MFDFKIIFNIYYLHGDMQVEVATEPKDIVTPEELKKAMSIILSANQLPLAAPEPINPFQS